MCWNETERGDIVVFEMFSQCELTTYTRFSFYVNYLPRKSYESVIMTVRGVVSEPLTKMALSEGNKLHRN